MSAFANWLLSDLKVPEAAHAEPETSSQTWWKVMCLTGVDYFSSLGYAPGIAFLAAGALSPIATLILVLVTLFAAYPAYSRVAEASPDGRGSIAMLERLFPQWYGKIFVIVLLGFATTDFIITMTLSAADGAAHLIQNPFFPKFDGAQMLITILILAVLAGVFLRGFKEAVGVAVILVALYLSLNAIVAGAALWQVLSHPTLVPDWQHRLFAQHSSPLAMIGIAILLFPRLALGLSGFETGVAVMPLIDAESVEERVRNARKLLFSAAVIMSAFLIATSITTTLLIPEKAFQAGGEANGRAVAYLAHNLLGNVFGSVYDFSTIFILGFAGASAMAGLLNLVPRYLPRYGMAPEWARASRPLVFVFFAIAVLVTLIFKADVDAQGGAYATGVLVLMTSAAMAVAISAPAGWRKWAYGSIAAVFVYTTAANMYERPEGIKVASVFIACILFTSFLSRAIRSIELRSTGINFDGESIAILDEDEDQVIRFVAHNPTDCSLCEYEKLDQCIREAHHLSDTEKLIYLEASRGDMSDFDAALSVEGARVGPFSILRTTTPAVPNTMAAILIEVTKRTGKRAHIYFTWPEGNPFLLLLRFVFLGDGYVAPLVHEVLRLAVVDRDQRPLVHVV